MQVEICAEARVSVRQCTHPSSVLLSHVQSRSQAAQSLRVLVLHTAQGWGAGGGDTDRDLSEDAERKRILKKKKKNPLRREKRKGNNPGEVEGKVMEIK